MNIIYHCYGGAHSSVMAAAIHLGYVTKPKGVTMAEVVALPYFDIQDNSDMGCLRRVGVDYAGHQVFVMGRAGFSVPVRRLFTSIARQVGLDIGSFTTTNAISYVNPLMVVGGYLSRRLRIVRVGRSIVAFGSKVAAPYLASAVAATQARAADAGKLPPSANPRACDKIVVYYSSGTGLSAVVAAALHTERLSPEHAPRLQEVRELLASLGGLRAAGEVLGFGRDKHDALILAVGCSLATDIISRACPCFLEISGVPVDNVTMIESPKLSDSSSILGALAARCLRRGDLELRIACRALNDRFDDFSQIVRSARRDVARLDPVRATDG